MKKVKMTYLLILTLFMGLVFGGCEEEVQEPVFTLQGNWEGTNWYCNNPTKCAINPINKEAVINFTVTLNEGNIIVSPCKYTLPSCAPPGCGTSDWVVSFIEYANDFLTIKWSHGYTFKGVREGDKFIGNVTYQFSLGEYVWNDKVELIKK